MTADTPSILVVDDGADNRELLDRFLRGRYRVTLSESGKQALEVMRAQPFDVMLLDILMPEMDGFAVLEQLRADPLLRHVPVIVISAMTGLNHVARCIELGAEDYLIKPFNAVLLMARIAASLEKKRLRDAEINALALLKEEQRRSERLLHSILPRAIVERLKRGQTQEIADSFADVTVLFADIYDFSRSLAGEPPTQVLKLLNRFFSHFDRLAERHGVQRIKTIGDAYMAVGGLPDTHCNHAQAIAELALSMQSEVPRLDIGGHDPFSLRIGINTGPVVAGVVGTSKFAYDLWGETVNIASHMESLGLPGAIQVSAATYRRLRDTYLFEERGTFYIKGAGEVDTYMLRGKRRAEP